MTTLGKDMVIQRLRNALQGAVKEVRSDPDFAGKIITTVCTELGMDAMAAMYLSSKLKGLIRKKAKGDE